MGYHLLYHGLRLLRILSVVFRMRGTPNISAGKGMDRQGSDGRGINETQITHPRALPLILPLYSQHWLLADSSFFQSGTLARC